MAIMLKPTGVNYIWASAGTYTDPGVAKTVSGYVVELPPYQTQNWIDWKQDSFIAHVNQRGIPEWDSATEYQGNKSYTQGSNGLVYKCITTCTNVDPASTGATGYWLQAFESYGAVAIVASALSQHLSNYAVLAGIANIATARTNLNVWGRSESDLRYAPIAGNASQSFSVGPATLPDHAVPLSQLTGSLAQASETVSGVAKVATNAEVAAGVIDTKMITPLKAATVLLSKAGNLSGITNAATARANLGLGSMALESSTGFLRSANNLSDLSNTSGARANLGLTSTAILPETYFLRVNNNLADVNPAASRNNLGLSSTATTDISTFLLKSDNLTGLANPATARANLGLADMATVSSTVVMFRPNNLSDLSNVQAARNNLGLGNLATKNVTGIATADLNFTASVDAAGGATRMPDGSIFQWGRVTAGQSVTFRIPYTISCAVVCQHGPQALGAPGSGISAQSLTGFTLGYGTGGYMWHAIGV
jgi:hypothetical protein